MKLIQKSRIQQRTKLIPHHGESKESEFFPALSPVQEAPRLRAAHSPDTRVLDSNKSPTRCQYIQFNDRASTVSGQPQAPALLIQAER